MDLPKVYANKINKKLNNTQDVFYGSDNSYRTESDVSIIQKIDNIFKSYNHVYKSKVEINTNSGVIIKDIVGKTNGFLLTASGEKISVNDILDIKKIY